MKVGASCAAVQPLISCCALTLLLVDVLGTCLVFKQDENGRMHSIMLLSQSGVYNAHGTT